MQSQPTRLFASPASSSMLSSSPLRDAFFAPPSECVCDPWPKTAQLSQSSQQQPQQPQHGARSRDMFDTSWLADIMSQLNIPPAPPSTDGEMGHEDVLGVATPPFIPSEQPQPQPQQLASPFQSPCKTKKARTKQVPDWFDVPRPSTLARCKDTPAPPPIPVHRNAPAASIPRSLPAQQTLFSVFVSGLEAHVTDNDLVMHFMYPPCWPDDHPLKHMHFRLQSVTGLMLQVPSNPAPFHVHSARVVRESSSMMSTGSKRVFGFVRLLSKYECDRALIEMQHTQMIPKNPPHTPLRLYLGAASAPPKQATHDAVRGMDRQARSVARFTPARPPSRTKPRMSRTDTSVPSSAPSSVSSPPPPVHSPPPSSHECVPTILTFVSEGKRDDDTPDFQLASALTMAHTSSALDPMNTTVFVGSLFPMATEATLHALFSPFGPIDSINIPRGQDCGFVQFVHKRDAARAISELQGHQLSSGAALRLSWGRSVGEKAAARAAIRAGLRWVEDSTVS